MGYFEEIGKRIGHVSKSAVKKAAAIADGAGLSMQFNGLERERDRICRDLGAAYFARHGTAPEPELAELCCAAAQKTAEIEALKQRLQRLKNQKLCPACGFTNPRENCYCSKCGSKLPEIFEDGAPEAGAPCGDSASAQDAAD